MKTITVMLLTEKGERKRNGKELRLRKREVEVGRRSRSRREEVMRGGEKGELEMGNLT